MKTVSRFDHIIIPTTPKELRKIADALEKGYARATPGDRLPSYAIVHEERLKIELIVDQPAMPK